MTSIAADRLPARSRVYWMPAGFAVVFGAVTLSHSAQLAFMIVAFATTAIAMLQTRGQSVWSGLFLGALFAGASLAVIWYVDTHTLTTAGAIVFGSALIAAAVIARAFILRRRSV